MTMYSYYSEFLSVVNLKIWTRVSQLSIFLNNKLYNIFIGDVWNYVAPQDYITDQKE